MLLQQKYQRESKKDVIAVRYVAKTCKMNCSTESLVLLCMLAAMETAVNGNGFVSFSKFMREHCLNRISPRFGSQ